MIEFLKKFPVRPKINEIKNSVNILNQKLKLGEFKFIDMNCICCNKRNEKTLFVNDRYGIRQKTVMCKNCGFVYLNPRADSNSLTKFYESDLYRDIYHPSANYDYKWNQKSMIKSIIKMMKMIMKMK